MATYAASLAVGHLCLEALESFFSLLSREFDALNGCPEERGAVRTVEFIGIGVHLSSPFIVQLHPTGVEPVVSHWMPTPDSGQPRATVLSVFIEN